ncbi:hypothetical protein KY285_023893 [Solanum tuberosum]|nr:hypothetical protein KY289_024225 [Solanum tuberosum]KAH0676092.1 hypothetical protein KY285_023893 [Solanum tuberosum]
MPIFNKNSESILRGKERSSSLWTSLWIRLKVSAHASRAVRIVFQQALMRTLLISCGKNCLERVKRVFGKERCPDELLVVGEEIARKCAGLPFLLDLIGGVIARKEKIKALLLEVLNNLNSLILKDEEEVMKVIDHLSDHLKPCLFYLASYPKDKDIKISELEHLWSTEGLVEQTEMKVLKKY